MAFRASHGEISFIFMHVLHQQCAVTTYMGHFLLHHHHPPKIVCTLLHRGPYLLLSASKYWWGIFFCEQTVNYGIASRRVCALYFVAVCLISYFSRRRGRKMLKRKKNALPYRITILFTLIMERSCTCCAGENDCLCTISLPAC